MIIVKVIVIARHILVESSVINYTVLNGSSVKNYIILVRYQKKDIFLPTSTDLGPVLQTLVYAIIDC